MVCKTQVLLALKNSFHPFFIFFFYLVFIAVIHTGCGNDPETANILTQSKSVPGMMAKNIEVTFSDSGKIQAKLYSILLNRYPGGDPFMEFPKGFKVCIYDSAMRVETTISGNYGKRKDYSRIMEAKGDVVVRNELKKRTEIAGIMLVLPDKKYCTDNAAMIGIASIKLFEKDNFSGLDMNAVSRWSEL